MKTIPKLGRRSFLKRGGLAMFAAMQLESPTLAATAKARPWKICAFEKPVQSLSYDELSDLIAEAGFDGIEATVRPGGHITPERAEDELPKLVEALKKRRLEVTILTSGINDAAQPYAEKVLRTAAKLGIERYRMLWWRYDLARPIWPQIEALRPILKDLVALNRQVGITGLYQNHSGAEMVGASLWDIFDLIKPHSPKDICLAYDVHHAQVEGGLAWPAQFHLVKSHIAAVCVKDFVWDVRKVKDVPLGTGRVDNKVFSLLRQDGFTGPFSVHVEYGEGSKKEFFASAFRKDREALQGWLS